MTDTPPLTPEAASKCRFGRARIGSCNAPATHGAFCEMHSQTACRSCGQPATHECSYTGQFVCGFPLCDQCHGWEDTSKWGGAWGFLNHAHKRKDASDV